MFYQNLMRCVCAEGFKKEYLLFLGIFIKIFVAIKMRFNKESSFILSRVRLSKLYVLAIENVLALIVDFRVFKISVNEKYMNITTYY